MKKFKTQTQLADFLGTTQAAISRWVSQGMPHEQPGGPMTYHFELEKVLRWLCERSPRHRRWVGNLAERVSNGRE